MGRGSCNCPLIWLLRLKRANGRIVMLEMIATLSFVTLFTKSIFAEGEKAENLPSQARLIRLLNRLQYWRRTIKTTFGLDDAHGMLCTIKIMTWWAAASEDAKCMPKTTTLSQDRLQTQHLRHNKRNTTT